jgi:uncharacterized protein YjiS (DUF1127 family)
MSSPTYALRRTLLAAAAERPARLAPGPITRALDLLAEWRARARDRRHLAALGSRALRDMGLDHAAVWSECSKPFWRA